LERRFKLITGFTSSADEFLPSARELGGTCDSPTVHLSLRVPDWIKKRERGFGLLRRTEPIRAENVSFVLDLARNDEVATEPVASFRGPGFRSPVLARPTCGGPIS